MRGAADGFIAAFAGARKRWEKTMALIEWNDSLSVNIVEIDQQHRKLVGMINHLNDAMRQGKGKESLSKIINGLVAYAGTHFRTEEKYFDEFGYPDKDRHRQEHKGFTRKVAAFKDEFEAGKRMLSMEIMMFLSDWLQNHIKVVDKKYAPFLNAKGLK
jgi:hemerythrin